MQLVILNKILTEKNVWKTKKVLHKLIWSSMICNRNLLVEQIMIYHNKKKLDCVVDEYWSLTFQVCNLWDTDLVRQNLTDILHILTKDVMHYLREYRSLKFVWSSNKQYLEKWKWFDQTVTEYVR